MRENGIGLSQAFGILTIIPSGNRVAKKASTQLFFYPFVGLFLGLVGTLLVWPMRAYMKSSILLFALIGILWTIYMAFITRGFHLDGLGDMADGFGGGWTVERRLEIMKDSRMGSFGVIAICLCLLLKAASAAMVVSSGRIALLLWSCVVSRFCVVLMCSVCEYAKPEGLSHDLVSGAGLVHSAVGLAQVLAYGALALVLGSLVGEGVNLFLLICPLCVGIISAAVLALVSYRRIGGVTGDILGACCEVSECLCLLCCAFFC